MQCCGSLQEQGLENFGSSLTPGRMARTVKPSFSSANAHWILSMFIAVLVILQSTVGTKPYRGANAMDPIEVELRIASATGIGDWVSTR